jgi:hypothetical protein
MKKSLRVAFKMQRITEGDRHIIAERPGAEAAVIKGLKSKADVDEWLAAVVSIGSDRKVTRNHSAASRERKRSLSRFMNLSG